MDFRESEFFRWSVLDLISRGYFNVAVVQGHVAIPQVGWLLHVEVAHYRITGGCVLITFHVIMVTRWLLIAHY
jgi:hypothetical protein